MEKNVKKIVDHDEPVIQKSVNDIGIAAYIMMHGYKVIGRRNKTIFFEVKQSEISEFDRLAFEYLSSPFHSFDNNLMALKKIGEYDPNGHR